MIGKVTISPDVVREVARITTLATPGVLAMAERPAAHSHGNGDPGVDVTVEDERVQIRLRVIAAAAIPLHKLGQQIQTNVASAIVEIAGMTVTSVDVAFEDVRSKA
jgi:uncharacterized alkaline shock family protein YloU